MYAEYDEGLGVSPTSHSVQRDFSTFQPDDEDYSYAPSVTKNHTQKSFVFPQKLDLSMYPKGNSTSKSKSRTHGKKKWSPIKAHHDTALNPHETRRDSSILGNKTVDLDLFRKEIEEIAANVLNNSMRKSVRSSASSVTSDRAPSVSSTSTASRSQRSLSIQIKRAKELAGGINTQKVAEFDAVFDDTDFHLTSDDDTRPPSSQASLTFEVDRRGKNSSDVITNRHHTRSDRRQPQSSPSVRNAATSTSVVLSDSYLEEIYGSRRKNRREDEENDATLVEIADKTLEDEVFDTETPILTNVNSQDSGLKRIEVGRNVCSSTGIANLYGEKDKRKEPTVLHHSLSSSAVPQNQLRTQILAMQDDAHVNRSLPNLDRFFVRQSTRNMFNVPLDIDAICGKGVRRNQKSSDRIFGGTEIARNIHGDPPSKPPSARRPLTNVASRPTTASTAKQREPSKSRIVRQPPYCSATQTDGIPYSIASVSQQLLGTVKSLHPDWLQMTRRVLDDKTIEDVAETFSEELRKQQMALEMKYSRNQRHGGAEPEEFDDQRTKLCVIFRILEKIGELRSRGGHYSRVQQIKLIHNALLSA